MYCYNSIDSRLPHATYAALETNGIPVMKARGMSLNVYKVNVTFG